MLFLSESNSLKLAKGILSQRYYGRGGGKRRTENLWYNNRKHETGLASKVRLASGESMSEPRLQMNEKFLEMNSNSVDFFLFNFGLTECERAEREIQFHRDAFKIRDSCFDNRP